jgi:hypothetical protein
MFLAYFLVSTATGLPLGLFFDSTTSESGSPPLYRVERAAGAV